jgi:hypothetical protein
LLPDNPRTLTLDESDYGKTQALVFYGNDMADLFVQYKSVLPTGVDWIGQDVMDVTDASTMETQYNARMLTTINDYRHAHNRDAAMAEYQVENIFVLNLHRQFHISLDRLGRRSRMIQASVGK